MSLLKYTVYLRRTTPEVLFGGGNGSSLVFQKDQMRFCNVVEELYRGLGEGLLGEMVSQSRLHRNTKKWFLKT